MIFQRAALREFASTAIAVFVALFAIMLTTVLIRLLTQAAGDKLASDAVVALLGFRAINYLPVLLSLSLFIAVLLSMARSYRDSEMVVWFSCGLPLTAWVRPVLTFAIPMVATISLLALFLTPWALSKSAEYRQKMDNRNDVSRVAPGAFKESSSADRVFFVEEVSVNPGNESGATRKGTGRVKNIFISSVQHGRLGVMAAANGHQEVFPNGDHFLVMENGRRYEGTPGQADYRVMQFERYAVRVESREAQDVVMTPQNLTLLQLVANPTAPNLGELLWRIGIPLEALNLALLAIPLSFVNPRSGRTNNLIFAMLTYYIYSTLISVSQNWVAQGRLDFWIGVWLVHLVMFVLLLLLFSRRLMVFSWARLWR